MNLDEELIARERAALDRWITGDTEGFLDLCDPEILYFDTNAEQRIEGTAALQKHLAMHGRDGRPELLPVPTTMFSLQPTSERT